MVPEYNLENFKEWLRENPAERKDLSFWEEFAQWLDHLNFAIPRLTTVVLDEKK